MKEPSRLLAYGVAVLAVAVAYALAVVLWPYIQPTHSPLFIAAIMIASVYGGLGPGLLATVLSSVATAYFYMGPPETLGLQANDVLRLAVFCFVALLTNSLASGRRLAERRGRQQMENARELQQLSTRLVRAQEEERRIIARELHDEIGQALTAIRMELAVAERELGILPDAEGPLGEIGTISDRALQAVRDLSQLLHPAMLDDLGLPATLEWYLNGFSKRTGIRMSLEQGQMEERLAPELETCIYRVVQEAVTNVARHAKASSCRVRLLRQRDVIRLTVEDDGAGFRVEPGEAGKPRLGLGLLSVKERIAGFRGTLQVDSSPGKGTRLVVELPALPRVESHGKGDTHQAFVESIAS